MNPAMALARILATMHDADGHIAIPGFYDKVRPLTDKERTAIATKPRHAMQTPASSMSRLATIFAAA